MGWEGFSWLAIPGYSPAFEVSQGRILSTQSHDIHSQEQTTWTHTQFAYCFSLSSPASKAIYPPSTFLLGSGEASIPPQLKQSRQLPPQISPCPQPTWSRQFLILGCGKCYLKLNQSGLEGCSRAVAALAENPGSISGNHMVAYNCL